jgi:hypothetical protein
LTPSVPPDPATTGVAYSGADALLYESADALYVNVRSQDVNANTSVNAKKATVMSSPRCAGAAGRMPYTPTAAGAECAGTAASTTLADVEAMVEAPYLSVIDTGSCAEAAEN